MLYSLIVPTVIRKYVRRLCTGGWSSSKSRVASRVSEEEEDRRITVGTYLWYGTTIPYHTIVRRLLAGAASSKRTASGTACSLQDSADYYYCMVFVSTFVLSCK